MPTYSYACKNCEHKFDVQQSFTDEEMKVCPNCKGELRKVFGNLGVTFKGTGFYANDHGSKSSKKSD